jgi:hypothetical protein
VRRAVNVGLWREGVDGRLRGVVSVVKAEQQYAFIDCVGHTDDNRVFVHWSEFSAGNGAQAQSAWAEGTCVEFNLCWDPSGKQSATRIKLLPKGSVSFEETIAGPFQGVVQRVAKAATKNPKFPKPSTKG